MSALEQAVVLCGGPGTRLRPLLGDVPKVLAPVAGRSLLAHLLGDLATAGTREVLLLTGVGAEQVAKAAERLSGPLGRLGLSVHVEREGAPRGTAGALHGVAARLAPRFLLVYGDVFTSLDWRRLAETADGVGGLATLVAHRSDHPEDSDVLDVADDGRIIGWSTRQERARSESALLGAGAAIGNAGVAALSRDVLRFIPRERPCDLNAELLPRRVDARDAVHAYVTSEYLRDAGTPRRLGEVDDEVRAGRHHRRAELALLDRDGVLVQERGPILRPDDLQLLPGAAAALRRLNEAGVRVALVTNQAAVARGLCSREALRAVETRLVDLLAEEGARLDSVHTCLWHPEIFHGEGVASLRGPSRCRKPSTGLIEEALDFHHARAWRTVLVGDGTIDAQTARNAGLASIGVETGLGGRDRRFPARPTWRFRDIEAASRWMVGTPQRREGAGEDDA